MENDIVSEPGEFYKKQEDEVTWELFAEFFKNKVANIEVKSVYEAAVISARATAVFKYLHKHIEFVKNPEKLPTDVTTCALKDS